MSPAFGHAGPLGLTREEGQIGQGAAGMRPGSGRSFFGEASSSYGVLSGSGLAFGMVSRFARSAGSRSKQKIKNDMAERFGAHAGSDFLS